MRLSAQEPIHGKGADQVWSVVLRMASSRPETGTSRQSCSQQRARRGIRRARLCDAISGCAAWRSIGRSQAGAGSSRFWSTARHGWSGQPARHKLDLHPINSETECWFQAETWP